MHRWTLLTWGALLAGCTQPLPAPVVGGRTGGEVHVVSPKPAASAVATVAAAPVAPAASTAPAIVAEDLAPAGSKASAAPRVAVAAKATTALKPEAIEPAAGVAPQKAKDAPAKPRVTTVMHKVAAGETIYRISRQYHVSVLDIMAANDFDQPQDLKSGTLVKVPTLATPEVASVEPAKAAAKPEAAPVAAKALESASDKPAVADAPAQPAAVAVAAPVRASSKGDGSLASEIKGILKAHEAAPAQAPAVEEAPAESAVRPETAAKEVRTEVAGEEDSPTKALAGHEAAPRLLEPETQAGVKDVAKVSAKEPAVAVREPEAAPKAKEEAPKVAAKASPNVEEGASGVEVAAADADEVADDASDKPEVLKTSAKAPASTDTLKAEMKRGKIDPIAAKADGKVWPVKGIIIRKFGEQGSGVSHTGINIAVPPGTPVLATDDGLVLYADEGLKTYGKLVLLRHSNGLVSAYAHNGHLLVRKGEKVRKGQVIATSGASGNVDRPQLHFELRRQASAVDPLGVLPKL